MRKDEEENWRLYEEISRRSNKKLDLNDDYAENILREVTKMKTKGRLHKKYENSQKLELRWEATHKIIESQKIKARGGYIKWKKKKKRSMESQQQLRKTQEKDDQIYFCKTFCQVQDI